MIGFLTPPHSAKRGYSPHTTDISYYFFGYICAVQFKFCFMKVNLSNSIYQQKGSGYGLNVKDGMLINNRLNSQTGIQEAIQLKQSLKRAQKVAALSEGVALGNSISEMKDHENGCGM